MAFASVMLALVGALNLIDGIAAVADSKFFTANATFVLSDLNTLGWALIVIGSVQALTAIGVWMRTTGARWIGVAFAASTRSSRCSSSPPTRSGRCCCSPSTC